MKRYQFIRTAAVAMASAPFLSRAKNNAKTTRTEKGFKTNAGDGRTYGHIRLKGVNSNILDVKISGKDNDGALAFFEQTSLTPGRGTPLHVHHFQDEIFYVIAGTYFFQVGDQQFHMEAGDTIFLPMKVPHAWTQISATGKMTLLFQPAGKMEAFFLKIAALEKAPTKEELAAIFSESDMQIVGPPLQVPES